MARRIQVEIIGDSRSVERAFKRAGGAANSFSGRMARVGKSVAAGFAGLASAAVAIGVVSVKAAADFEKTMSRVIGLAGQSQKQVAAWSDQLLLLGPALGKTPRELAEALYFISSAGIPASKAISVLVASAKASAAGLGETQIVADAVTSVMNAYGIATMSAARATDVLVATVREGKGEAEAFAPTIGNVTAFASRLKVRFEEVGAALAAMTQLGTDPRIASVQLQAFFAQLLKVTPKAEKAAASVGLSFDDLRKTLSQKGLLATLDMIKDAFKGDTKAMAEAFPNIRALRALLALTAEDGGKVTGIFNRMGASSGSMGKAFAAAQKTASFNLASFWASVETLRIAFGQGLLPVVTKVAQTLARKLADPAFVARVRELGVLVGTNLYAAFTAIGTWFQDHWPQIQTGFRIAGEMIRAMAKAIKDLRPVFGILAKIANFVIRNSMIRPMMAFLAVISGVLTVLSKLPFIGGKFSGAVESVNATRESLSGINKALTGAGAGRTGPRRRVRGAGRVREAPGALRPRAMGGPVMPGGSYLVGERGPEMFVPNAAGNVMPGGGGVYIANINLPGVRNAQDFMRELQRIAKSNPGSRSGRYGGRDLALG